MKIFASHDDVPAGIETLQRVLKPGNVVLLDGYVGKTLIRPNDRVKHEFSDTDYAVFTGVILASTSEEDMGTITEAEYKKWLNGGRVGSPWWLSSRTVTSGTVCTRSTGDGRNICPGGTTLTGP